MSVEWACKRWVVHQPTSILECAGQHIHYFERHISCIKYTEKMDKHAKFVWINWNHLFPFQSRIGNSQLNKVQKCWKPGPSMTLEGLHVPGDWCDHHEGCPSIPAFTHAKRSQSTFKRASNSPHPLLICQFSRIHQSVHLQVTFDRNVYIILQYNTGPIPPMYSIFTCVWLIFITHVGKYTMTMDGIYIYGKMASQCIWLSHLPQQKSQASEVPKPTSKISGCVSQLGNLVGATHNNTWQHGGTMDRNLGQILEDMENNWSPDILVGGCDVILKFLMETNALRTK